MLLTVTVLEVVAEAARQSGNTELEVKMMFNENPLAFAAAAKLVKRERAVQLLAKDSFTLGEMQDLLRELLMDGVV